MLTIKNPNETRWDIVSLGEVMLRFDPGDERIHTARSFTVCEGGGEYNVARSLSRSFGMRTGIVTALADNQLGRLVEGLMLQGGVDVSNVLWRPVDGISRDSRNGIYFIERGFGPRSPSACSDRGNTAVSQLRPGEIDWKSIFEMNGACWFHTGGIFAGLSETTAQVAHEAMAAARAAGTIVSYDLNYRESLWSGRGGREAADKVNENLLKNADVVFGVPGFNSRLSDFDEVSFREAAIELVRRHPNIRIAATTLRNVHNASRHDLSGAAFASGAVSLTSRYEAVDVLDRVGSGDAFAAGLVYGFLNDLRIEGSLKLGVANAVLKLASVGDRTSATLAEIRALSEDRGHGVSR